MKKDEIIVKLRENHQILIDFIQNLNKEQFLQQNNGKWTAGQQLEHIHLSVKPLAKGLILPKFLLKLILGKANRPSKSYENLVLKYKNVLQNGAQATGQFVPMPVVWSRKEEIVAFLTKNVNKLCTALNKFSEEDLDLIIIPHPVLGKLTLREMMYFTIYHAEHHLNHTKNNLVS